MISPQSDTSDRTLPGDRLAVPARNLAGGWIAYHFDVVGSTNDEARKLAAEDAPHRSVVIADAQSSGRGRRGRSWSSPVGNLYASALLRLDLPAPRAGELTFLASLALRTAIEQAGAEDARVKWPNDVLVGGKKVSGLLLESELRADGNMAFAIVGSGVNLVSFPADVLYPATSLTEATGRVVTPDAFLKTYLPALDGWLDRWLANGFGDVRKAWLDVAYGVGAPMEARTHAETVHGVFEDLNEQGGLVLRLDGGGHHVVAAGDVFPGSRAC